MKQPDTMTVTILGKEYCLTCPAEKRLSLKRTAEYVDKIMREIRSAGKAIGTERIAVTAALNIAYELLEKEPTIPDTEQQEIFGDAKENSNKIV